LAQSERRILVVDDEDDVREFLKTALEATGHTVETVASGEEAVRVFREEPFALVITDLKMPGQDGFEVLRSVREIVPDTVVVILTGYGSVKDAVNLMREGAYGILTKPCSIQEILATVEKGLKHHELRTRNQELQAQLDRSQRLAMIGKLAAGVAHELNSPLDGVLRFVKLSLSNLDEDSDVRPWLEESVKGLDRMASIIRSLLTFSRNVVLEHEEADLGELLSESIRNLRVGLGDRNVKLATGEVPPGTGVPKGLIQVFTNILKNAIDASPEGGTVHTSVSCADGHIIVRIRDEGPGIPESVQSRVFEPFFTTKEAGKGTGLGLPICARIMERFNGTIEIGAVPEGGTQVVLRIPVTKNARLATVSKV
jgi:signal transduction histidine kinase